MFYFTEYTSPVGLLTIACNDHSICGLWLEGQKYFSGALPEIPTRNDNAAVLRHACLWLDEYFTGKNPPISQLPLNPAGSKFRQAVWQCLCAVPYGQITTYGKIADKVADMLDKTAMSPQAVGGAVGHNPISIIIPCHRVVGANANLTGYAGGIEKKLWLLNHEGVDTRMFSLPKHNSASQTAFSKNTDE